MHELTPLRAMRGGLLTPLDALRREVDRLFEDVTHDGLGRGGIEVHMDVEETKDALIITAEAPGVEPEDIELTIRDGILTLRGEKRMEREETKNGRRLSERTFGAFQRQLSLPSGVDAAGVKAMHRNGVLTVTIPRSNDPDAQGRRIPIEAARAPSPGKPAKPS